jgi:hypothetical protein
MENKQMEFFLSLSSLRLAQIAQLAQLANSKLDLI